MTISKRRRSTSQRQHAARRDLRLPAELAKLDRFDLLICDDFSYVRSNQGEASGLFELIAKHYERKSLAITANQPFFGWNYVFAESTMTLTAVDRLVHHATIFEMTMESFRRRVAQKGLAPSEQRNPSTPKPKGSTAHASLPPAKIIDADRPRY